MILVETISLDLQVKENSIFYKNAINGLIFISEKIGGFLFEHFSNYKAITEGRSNHCTENTRN